MARSWRMAWGDRVLTARVGEITHLKKSSDNQMIRPVVNYSTSIRLAIYHISVLERKAILKID
jgi:hypothetical protein